MMLNSFRYGIGALFFLFGFLTVAKIIRELVEGFITFSLRNREYLKLLIFELSLLTGVYWVLFQNNKWLSLASVLMSLLYGGLSANISAAKALKRFQRSNEV